MSAAYIKEVRVQGFGCVDDATLKLTRLHALIGPNDSGKTTLLRAMRTAMQFTSGTREETNDLQKLSAAETGLTPGANTMLAVTVSGGQDERETTFTAKQTPAFSQISESLSSGERVDEFVRSGWNGAGLLSMKSLAPYHGISTIAHLQQSPRWLHLSAAAMRRDSKLFTESEPKVLDPTGSRLPAIYDAILNRGDDTFLRISEEVRQFFPPIKNIRLKNVAQDTKAFEIELHGGQKVPASFISDGVLYFLAFAALEHTEPASVLLIEEPENGLHPSRIADVMRVLRRLSERVQIVLATHSPFVINELQGDEVTVVTRPEGKGTQVRRLSDTPNFEERSKVYALGELWVSYADGKDEHALLSPPDTAE